MPSPTLFVPAGVGVSAMQETRVLARAHSPATIQVQFWRGNGPINGRLIRQVR